jgi:hypothetical protein
MVDRVVRIFIGILVLLSAVLAAYEGHGWIWLTIILGANLVQSAFTDWCPMLWLFPAERDVAHRQLERLLRGLMGFLILFASELTFIPNYSKTGFILLPLYAAILVLWWFPKAKPPKNT